jgi:hypothetical protein
MEVVSPLHSNNKMKRQQYSFGADRRVNGIMSGS